MKKILLLLSIFVLVTFRVFSVSPEIPIIEDSERDVDISEGYNYINNSCTNTYFVYAVKDVQKNIYGIYFSNTSCLSDTNVTLAFSFKNEKMLNTYLKTINTSNLEKTFEEYRIVFITHGVEPLNIYTTDRTKLLMQLYEYNIY